MGYAGTYPLRAAKGAYETAASTQPRHRVFRWARVVSADWLLRTPCSLSIQPCWGSRAVYAVSSDLHRIRFPAVRACTLVHIWRIIPDAGAMAGAAKRGSIESCAGPPAGPAPRQEAWRMPCAALVSPLADGRVLWRARRNFSPFAPMRSTQFAPSSYCAARDRWQSLVAPLRAGGGFMPSLSRLANSRAGIGRPK